MKYLHLLRRLSALYSFHSNQWFSILHMFTFSKYFERWGFPRWASILTIFIGLIAIIAIVVSFIAPIIISNINNLIKRHQRYKRS